MVRTKPVYPPSTPRPLALHLGMTGLYSLRLDLSTYDGLHPTPVRFPISCGLSRALCQSSVGKVVRRAETKEVDDLCEKFRANRVKRYKYPGASRARTRVEKLKCSMAGPRYSTRPQISLAIPDRLVHAAAASLQSCITGKDTCLSR